MFQLCYKNEVFLKENSIIHLIIYGKYSLVYYSVHHWQWNVSSHCKISSREDDFSIAIAYKNYYDTCNHKSQLKNIALDGKLICNKHENENYNAPKLSK